MLFAFLLILIVLYLGIILSPHKFFQYVSAVAAPIVRLYIKRRIHKGLEDGNRQKERFGFPSQNRPNGKLVWIHAVSVGEVLSVIPFILEFKKIKKDVNILLTTTTLTSAKLIGKRLGDSVIHQFMPFDVFKWVRRFVKYWKPDMAFFVEAELWPNILYYLHEKDIPVYLLNARISNKSLKRFYLAKKFLKINLFKLFKKVYVPSNEMLIHIGALGGKDVVVIPNLKTMSEKLPVNTDTVKKLSKKIKGRKAWMAVSAHSGEEEIILEVHKKLKKIHPNILTVIAIRHPARADEVSQICDSFGLSWTRHTISFPTSATINEDVYILDEIGNLGGFFEVIDAVLVCGSLIPGIGGHNILEPLRFACNVATGEYIENFRDIYQYFKDYCGKVKNPDDIYNFVAESLESYKRDTEKIKSIDSTGKWIDVIKETTLAARF
ncbi:MAG: hypothetical protein LBM19_03305 [Holosporales bacterium]|jgi:3-deoxy-D-manno-octulosonic-acid transferase|nr:hypothetical protein [Holosporales bacterium]